MSVHPVVAPVSLPPKGALPKLFPAVSCPFSLSSLPSRSLPIRSLCRRFRFAPSQESSPQAISHGFLSVHPVLAPVSLFPTGPLPKLFSLFPVCSTPSSLDLAKRHQSGPRFSSQNNTSRLKNPLQESSRPTSPVQENLRLLPVQDKLKKP